MAGTTHDTRHSVDARETTSLIASDKVEGTNVYDHAGNKLGSIDTVMIDKTSGQVSYAVLSFGGFLGFGESHYPLPWDQLRYDTRQDGYVVGITEEQLKGAPSYGMQDTVDWTDSTWRGSIDSYYGAGRADDRRMGEGSGRAGGSSMGTGSSMGAGSSTGGSYRKV
ncbi:PRC-barrel domain-containing protein [Elioraea sp.]|uniref:PRC-barrel domain-containing protein n=1 Tax=Elioraea sp. TaxID=2185103 RepID=UPI0025C2702B|nr:PRC-barrel domain-containing protein [Elioraea sp.]